MKHTDERQETSETQVHSDEMIEYTSFDFKNKLSNYQSQKLINSKSSNQIIMSIP